MKKLLYITLLLTALACKTEKDTNGTLQVVTTTTMITDVVEQIGGDHIEVNAYKCSEMKKEILDDKKLI